LINNNFKTKSSHTQNGKMRITYFIFIFFTISLGLASRKYSYLLPPFLADHAGDALWAMMVYFCFRFILPRNQQSASIILSILFSLSIEFSQLYQANWINRIRSTTLGALILGKGFLTVDLIRYAIGILIGAVLDRFILVFTKYK
jgi:glycopeptide antibiotics resistance protein